MSPADENQPTLRERLQGPRRSLVVSFPVRRDDGEVQEFTGYRVQHTLVMESARHNATERVLAANGPHKPLTAPASRVAKGQRA